MKIATLTFATAVAPGSAVLVEARTTSAPPLLPTPNHAVSRMIASTIYDTAFRSFASNTLVTQDRTHVLLQPNIGISTPRFLPTRGSQNPRCLSQMHPYDRKALENILRLVVLLPNDPATMTKRRMKTTSQPSWKQPLNKTGSTYTP